MPLMLLMLALVAQHVQKKTRIMLVMLALVGKCSKGEDIDADDASSGPLARAKKRPAMLTMLQYPRSEAC